jgi:hypothetical protein
VVSIVDDDASVREALDGEFLLRVVQEAVGTRA